MEESDELPIPVPANRQAVISLVFAALTLVSFCVAVLPIPLSGVACYPATIICGLLAICYGVVSLYKLRTQKESGHHMAWAGIVVGSMALLCTICTAIALFAILYFSPDALHRIPFINRYL